MEGETGTCHTELTVKRGREGKGGEMLEEVLPSKTMLAVNAIPVKAANMSVKEHMESWKTPLTTMGRQVLFVVNSVKLHLTASDEKGHIGIIPTSTAKFHLAVFEL